MVPNLNYPSIHGDNERLIEVETEDVSSDSEDEFDITIPLTANLVPSKITDYFHKIQHPFLQNDQTQSQPPTPNPGPVSKENDHNDQIEDTEEVVYQNSNENNISNEVATDPKSCFECHEILEIARKSINNICNPNLDPNFTPILIGPDAISDENDQIYEDIVEEEYQNFDSNEDNISIKIVTPSNLCLICREILTISSQSLCDICESNFASNLIVPDPIPEENVQFLEDIEDTGEIQYQNYDRNDISSQNEIDSKLCLQCCKVFAMTGHSLCNICNSNLAPTLIVKQEKLTEKKGADALKRNHFKDEVQGNIHECKFCDEIFSRQVKLKYHIETVHLQDPLSLLNVELKSKRHWSYKEDQLLLKNLSKYGTKKWSFIASLMNGRTGQQCSDRYHYITKKKIYGMPWSKKEDDVLCEKQKEFGNQWLKIAQFLPQRTRCAVKNRWHDILKWKCEKNSVKNKHTLLKENIVHTYDNKRKENHVKNEKEISVVEEKSLKKKNVKICRKNNNRKIHTKGNLLVFQRRIKNIKCETCGKLFSYFAHLKQHQRSVHQDQKESKTNAKEIEPKNLSKNYQCKICEKKSTRKCNHGKVKCEICCKLLSHESYLKTHIMTIHQRINEKVKCEVCGKLFSNKGNLKTHIMTIHQRIKKFQCKTCGKECAQKMALHSHIKNNHGTSESFGKKLSGYQNVIWHIKNENDDPNIGKYCCVTCSEKFAKKIDLKRHVKSHSNNQKKV